MYFGSIRFFKHIIVIVTVIMILIPTGLCVVLIAEKEEMPGYANAAEEMPGYADATEEMPTKLDYQVKYLDLVCPELEVRVRDVEKRAALTFDDGPSDVTDEIINVLEEKNVKATFFVVGNQLDKPENQARLRRMVAEGHTVGIHTESHNYKNIYESVDSYIDDFYQAWREVKDITGVEAEIFRFPGGSINSYNSGNYQEIIAEMLRRGFVYYDWNVSSQDAADPRNVTPDTVRKNASKTKEYDNVILLMHDSEGKNATVEALPGIIDDLISKGYVIEPLSRQVSPVVFVYSE